MLSSITLECFAFSYMRASQLFFHNCLASILEYELLKQLQFCIYSMKIHLKLLQYIKETFNLLSVHFRGMGASQKVPQSKLVYRHVFSVAETIIKLEISNSLSVAKHMYHSQDMKPKPHIIDVLHAFKFIAFLGVIINGET